MQKEVQMMHLAPDRILLTVIAIIIGIYITLKVPEIQKLMHPSTRREKFFSFLIKVGVLVSIVFTLIKLFSYVVNSK